ncbi:MAG: hypothetical protein JWR68_3447 [Polaromonas sp.]|nr:hypothetical protein [Polaromonas sp.]
MYNFLLAQVMKLVDLADSKSAAERRAGSIPALGTILVESQCSKPAYLLDIAGFLLFPALYKCRRHLSYPNKLAV